jgi:hypothetical protein
MDDTVERAVVQRLLRAQRGQLRHLVHFRPVPKETLIVTRAEDLEVGKSRDNPSDNYLRPPGWVVLKPEHFAGAESYQHW